MRCLMLTLVPILALTGCASTLVKQNEVEAALVDAGLSRRMAACMARPMAEQLSVRQLRDLQNLAGLRRERIGDLTIGELATTLSRTDAETAGVVTRAGLGCAISG